MEIWKKYWSVVSSVRLEQGCRRIVSHHFLDQLRRIGAAEFIFIRFLSACVLLSKISFQSNRRRYHWPWDVWMSAAESEAILISSSSIDSQIEFRFRFLLLRSFHSLRLGPFALHYSIWYIVLMYHKNAHDFQECWRIEWNKINSLHFELICFEFDSSFSSKKKKIMFFYLPISHQRVKD